MSDNPNACRHDFDWTLLDGLYLPSALEYTQEVLARVGDPRIYPLGNCLGFYYFFVSLCDSGNRCFTRVTYDRCEYYPPVEVIYIDPEYAVEDFDFAQVHEMFANPDDFSVSTVSMSGDGVVSFQAAY